MFEVLQSWPHYSLVNTIYNYSDIFYDYALWLLLRVPEQILYF